MTFEILIEEHLMKKFLIVFLAFQFRNRYFFIIVTEHTVWRRGNPREDWQCWSIDIWTSRRECSLSNSSLSGRPVCTWYRHPSFSSTSEADFSPLGSYTGTQTRASECPETNMEMWFGPDPFRYCALIGTLSLLCWHPSRCHN